MKEMAARYATQRVEICILSDQKGENDSSQMLKDSQREQWASSSAVSGFHPEPGTSARKVNGSSISHRSFLPDIDTLYALEQMESSDKAWSSSSKEERESNGIGGGVDDAMQIENHHQLHHTPQRTGGIRGEKEKRGEEEKREEEEEEEGDCLVEGESPEKSLLDGLQTFVAQAAETLERHVGEVNPLSDNDDDEGEGEGEGKIALGQWKRKCQAMEAALAAKDGELKQAEEAWGRLEALQHACSDAEGTLKELRQLEQDVLSSSEGNKAQLLKQQEALEAGRDGMREMELAGQAKEKEMREEEEKLRLLLQERDTFAQQAVEYSQQSEQARASLQEQQEKLATLNKTHAAALEKQTLLQHECEQLRSEVAELSALKEKEQAANAEANAEAVEVASRNRQLQDMILESESKLATLQASQEAAVLELQEKEALVQRGAALQQEIGEMEEQKAKIVAEIGALEEEKRQGAADVLSIQEALTEMQGYLSELTDQHDLLRKELEVTRASCQQAEKAVGDKQSALRTVEREYAQTLATQTELLSELQTLQGDIDDASGELQTIRSACLTEQRGLDEKRRQYEDLEALLSQATERLQSLSVEADRLSADQAAAERQHAQEVAIRENAQKVEHDLTEKTENLRKQREELRQLTLTKQQLLSTVEGLQGNVEGLTAEVLRLEEERREVHRMQTEDTASLNLSSVSASPEDGSVGDAQMPEKAEEQVWRGKAEELAEELEFVEQENSERLALMSKALAEERARSQQLQHDRSETVRNLVMDLERTRAQLQQLQSEIGVLRDGSSSPNQMPQTPESFQDAENNSPGGTLKPVPVSPSRFSPTRGAVVQKVVAHLDTSPGDIHFDDTELLDVDSDEEGVEGDQEQDKVQEKETEREKESLVGEDAEADFKTPDLADPQSSRSENAAAIKDKQQVGSVKKLSSQHLERLGLAPGSTSATNYVSSPLFASPSNQEWNSSEVSSPSLSKSDVFSSNWHSRREMQRNLNLQEVVSRHAPSVLDKDQLQMYRAWVQEHGTELFRIYMAYNSLGLANYSRLNSPGWHALSDLQFAGFVRDICRVDNAISEAYAVVINFFFTSGSQYYDTYREMNFATWLECCWCMAQDLDKSNHLVSPLDRLDIFWESFMSNADRSHFLELQIPDEVQDLLKAKRKPLQWIFKHYANKEMNSDLRPKNGLLRVTCPKYVQLLMDCRMIGADLSVKTAIELFQQTILPHTLSWTSAIQLSDQESIAPIADISFEDFLEIICQLALTMHESRFPFRGAEGRTRRMLEQVQWVLQNYFEKILPNNLQFGLIASPVVKVM
jgi:hypothetical protein